MGEGDVACRQVSSVGVRIKQVGDVVRVYRRNSMFLFAGTRVAQWGQGRDWLWVRRPGFTGTISGRNTVCLHCIWLGPTVWPSQRMQFAEKPVHSPPPNVEVRSE